MVSLSSARKAKARMAEKAQADANAVRFGRTKAQKAAEKLAEATAKANHDAHKINP